MRTDARGSEIKRDPVPRDVSLSLVVVAAADELRMTLLDLENRVALAQRLFPMEAQVAMEIAQMKGTCDFIVTTSLEPNRVTTGVKRTSPELKITTTPFKFLEEHASRLKALSKTVALAQRIFPEEAQVAMEIAQMKGTCEFIVTTSFEPDSVTTSGKRSSPEVKITAPFEFVEKHQIRLKALSKTVELGKRFFPRCSGVLDEIMDCEALTELACGDGDNPDKRLQKKQRYMEIQEIVMKAFSADKKEFGNNSNFSASSTSSKSKSKSTGRKRCNGNNNKLTILRRRFS